jgi:putative sterol carrier protein
MTDEKHPESPAEESDAQPLRIDEAAEDISRAARKRSQELDDDDDTWTNQPAKDREEELGEDLEDDLEEDEQARAPRKAINNGRDVLCEELPDRAQRASLRMKPYLTSTLVMELTNSGERFLFDWREDVAKVIPLSREAALSCDETLGHVSTAEKVNVDSIISLSEQHLMSIRSGDLNPQVGMLTEKIRVKGKVSPAVYIFNLIAPRPRP